MTKKIILLFLIIMMAVQSATAVSLFEKKITVRKFGPLAPGTHYFDECWLQITGTKFVGSAKSDIKAIRTTFDKDLSKPLQKAIKDGTNEIITTHAASTSTIIKALADNYSYITQLKQRNQMDMMESELSYMHSLSQAEMDAEYAGFFGDGNGEGGEVFKDSESFEFVRNLCVRNKIQLAVSSQKSRSDSNKAVAEESKKMEFKSSQVLSAEAAHGAIQQTHYDQYCSEEDYNFGLCDEVSLFPLGDINATIALFPQGTGAMNIDKAGIFQTNYTYNEEESSVAKDYVNLVLYFNPTRKPTIDEITDPDKARFITGYNAKMAAINLSNYSFQKSIRNRTASVDNGAGMPMSQFDLYRYQIENTTGVDAKNNAAASNEQGVATMLYSSMLMENKLELERLQQQERIENLIAALNAAKVNNPFTLNYLNNSK